MDCQHFFLLLLLPLRTRLRLSQNKPHFHSAEKEASDKSQVNSKEEEEEKNTHPKFRNCEISVKATFFKSAHLLNPVFCQSVWSVSGWGPGSDGGNRGRRTGRESCRLCRPSMVKQLGLSLKGTKQTQWHSTRALFHFLPLPSLS